MFMQNLLQGRDENCAFLIYVISNLIILRIHWFNENDLYLVNLIIKELIRSTNVCTRFCFASQSFIAILYQLFRQ